MTDEQIIKYLECCGSKKKANCLNCDLYKTVPCRKTLIDNTLDLINRQKTEIERLQIENERFADIGKMYSEIRAEAIKEFWEKLKQTREFISQPYVYMYEGDNLINELTRQPKKIEHNSLCETETYESR